MQPEPTADSEHTRLVNSVSQVSLTSTQHGNHRHDDCRVPGPPLDEEARDSAGIDTHAPGVPDDSTVNSSNVEEATWPTVNDASLNATLLSQKGKATAMTHRVSLESLPNEVLTHTLSHLPPISLSSISLVSHRFHSLVTTPHAWRIAFSRYFPGPFSEEHRTRPDETDRFVSDRRFFARLTALASWRSEYILRTRLLRSLSKGKPGQFEPPKRGTTRLANIRPGSAISTYTSQLVFPVSHLGGSFGSEVTKKQPSFIHGAAEQGIASVSDPSNVKVGTWGLADFQRFRHFADLYPGESQFGLGAGDMVGMPNRMDVSQSYGMIYGEGCPTGRDYFISSTEQRGRFLSPTLLSSEPQLGIPALDLRTTGICSVWIAKSLNMLKMTGGLIGMLSGSSSGVLTSYSLGPNPTYERRFERGQATARWVLCPGVPIIAISVDDSYSPSRHARRRIWAAALNALGEIFYLTDIPCEPNVMTPTNPEDYDRIAWKTGRSVRWELVELSRRTARPDPFSREPVDGSYSPRSSSDSMKLDKQQVTAETKEIEAYLAFKPKHFRKVCEGWDMRRELRVDFAGDDGQGAGESFMVIGQGAGEDQKASMRRFTRKSVQDSVAFSTPSRTRVTQPSSIFGGPSTDTEESPSRASVQSNETVPPSSMEWFLTDFGFGDRKSIEITTSAMDVSTYALLTVDEDPLLGMSGGSNSSAMSSPLPHMESPRSEVPGQRARYMAIGTAAGTVFVWNIRSPTAQNSEVVNTVSPLRVIFTESPQVTSLALTSLYLVHGGNDGLVQAWDPLASTTGPIRTINSRFSSRARRRLVQAEASLLGVGNNYFAAGAICLDPDPTVLRGMVALGTHLRYWAYSSSAADQYKSGKRRLRRGQRGSNSSAEGHRFNSSGRGAIQGHIEEEVVEMERQEIADRKERAHLSSRFGVDLLGPDVSEEQVIAYAQLLSEESYNDAVKRGDSVASSVPSDTIPPDSSFGVDDVSSSSSPCQDTVDDVAPDIAEAIRLSLLENPEESSFAAQTQDVQSSKADEAPAAGSSRQQEMDDLDFAIQLSLAEEKSQAEVQEQEEFPALEARDGKGKGKAL